MSPAPMKTQDEGQALGADARAPASVGVKAATHTPGPWAWFGEAGSQSLHLATTHSGRRFVMQFARWGMRSAQPRFQVDSRMVDVSELVTFQVCHAVGVKPAQADRDCYRLTISGIDHPDARLIAAAPELFEALKMMLASHDVSCKGEECQITGVDLARAALAKVSA